jgi:PAS domain-containing protein
MAFSITVLLAISLAVLVVTRYHFDHEFPSSEDRVRATTLAIVESLALVIAGGTLLVRVCNPFLRRLEESEARIRAIVTTAGDGIITVDRQGTIHSFNRAAERMFLTSEEAVLGRNIDGWLELPATAASTSNSSWATSSRTAEIQVRIRPRSAGATTRSSFRSSFPCRVFRRRVFRWANVTFIP